MEAVVLLHGGLEIVGRLSLLPLPPPRNPFILDVLPKLLDFLLDLQVLLIFEFRRDVVRLERGHRLGVVSPSSWHLDLGRALLILRRQSPSRHLLGIVEEVLVGRQLRTGTALWSFLLIMLLKAAHFLWLLVVVVVTVSVIVILWIAAGVNLVIIPLRWLGRLIVEVSAFLLLFLVLCQLVAVIVVEIEVVESLIGLLTSRCLGAWFGVREEVILARR